VQVPLIADTLRRNMRGAPLHRRPDRPPSKMSANLTPSENPARSLLDLRPSSPRACSERWMAHSPGRFPVTSIAAMQPFVSAR